MNAPYAWLAYWMAYHSFQRAWDRFEAVFWRPFEDPERLAASTAYQAASQRKHAALDFARSQGERWPELKFYNTTHHERERDL
jgi:hypothetical protein